MERDDSSTSNFKIVKLPNDLAVISNCLYKNKLHRKTVPNHNEIKVSLKKLLIGQQKRSEIGFEMRTKTFF